MNHKPTCPKCHSWNHVQRRKRRFFCRECVHYWMVNIKPYISASVARRIKDPIQRQSAMLRMFRDGMTCAEIGKVFNCVRQRVHAVLKKDYTKKPTILPGISQQTHMALLRAGLNTRPKIFGVLRSGRMRLVQRLGAKRITEIQRAIENA